jgi:hypothetical protein
MKPQALLYGLMVEFGTPEELLHAARRAREIGYREMDAYAPYTVKGLTTELGQRETRIPSIMLIGGVVGAAVGYLMQYYSMVVSYAFNSGGRPFNSWPVFMPVTFEMMVLVASLAGFFGMLFLNGLPRPHHPLFSVPRFAQASQDRFFLCIEATDPKFDDRATAEFLAGLEPYGEVIEVPLYSPEEKA